MMIEELQKLIDQYRNTEQSKTSADIYLFSDQHLEKMKLEFGNFMKNFEDFFDDINMLIQILNYADKQNWPQSKGYQYLLLPETIKTLHCAYEITLNGYYDEAQILIRCVFENFLRIVFLSKYPDDLEGVLVTKPQNGVTKFNATNVVEHVLKMDSSWLYSLMSSFTHGKKPKMLRELTDRSNGKKGPIILEYQSDKESTASCINLLMLMQHLILRSMLVLFSTEIENTKKYQSRIDQIRLADNILEAIQTTNSNENFRTYVKRLIDNAALLFTSADSAKGAA